MKLLPGQILWVIAPTFAAFSTELLRWLTTRTVAVNDRGILLFAQADDYWVV
jgi:hypothetical protein